MIFRSFFFSLGFNLSKLLSLLIIIWNINTYADDYFGDNKKYKKVYIDSNVTKISSSSPINNVWDHSTTVNKEEVSTALISIPIPPKGNMDDNDIVLINDHKKEEVSTASISIPIPPKGNMDSKDTVLINDDHKKEEVSTTSISIPIPPKGNMDSKDTVLINDHKKEEVSTALISIPIPPKSNMNSKDTVSINDHKKEEVSTTSISIPIPPKANMDDKLNINKKTEIKSKKTESIKKPIKHEVQHTKTPDHHKDNNEAVEEEIIIEEVMLDTELYNRPTYNHKNVILPPTISKKKYSENNRHLPKAFYQNEYTDLLFGAVKSDDIQGIKSLIQSGANINAQEIENGYTPVMYAIKYNKIKALRSLILNGADLQKTNLQGQTALHVATISGNGQAIEVLLAARIDATIRDKKGNRASEYMKSSMKNTAVIMAANYQDMNKALIDFVGLSAYEAVQYTLQHGAKIDTKDDIGADGDTPLIIAIKCQDVKMISLLLNSGAKLDVQNKKKQTPMQIANSIKNQEIIGILKTVKINREIESIH